MDIIFPIKNNTKNLEIPKELSHLPINKTIPNIDLKKDFVMVAATSSGKTMLIPALIALKNNRVCILRQPTRKIAEMTYNALQKFWGDRLTIGIITSELKETEMKYLNHYNITVVTDGILSYLLKKLDLSRTTIILDECHWASNTLEIEMALTESYKRQFPSLQIVLLSATISPYLFVNYFEKSSTSPVSDPQLRDICYNALSEKVNTMLQPQKLKVYYSEGVTFPIKKNIIRITDVDDIDVPITNFCLEMSFLKHRGLVFLSTRNEIINAARKFSNITPTFFCHADTPVEELTKFIDLNKPGVVFATIALSTSITFPFNKTLILDKTNDACYDEILDQKISLYGIPCGSNEIIQKAGRVGRLFPGEATLLTNRNITWDDIRPTNIIPPLKKELPLTACLIAASHDIDIEHVHLLSDLPQTQINRSIVRLQQMKFIDDKNQITPLGKRALTLPLSPEDAKLILSTPTSFIPATAAFLSFPVGMFYLIDNSSASEKKLTTLHTRYNLNSIPLTKVLLLQDVYINSLKLKEWCQSSALNYKQMQMAKFNFEQIGSKFSKSPSEFSDELLDLTNPQLKSYKILIYNLMMKFNAILDGKGFNINNNGGSYFSFFSDPDFFTPKSRYMPVKVSGRFSLFQSKSQKYFGRICDATLMEEPL